MVVAAAAAAVRSVGGGHRACAFERIYSCECLHPCHAAEHGNVIHEFVALPCTVGVLNESIHPSTHSTIHPFCDRQVEEQRERGDKAEERAHRANERTRTVLMKSKKSLAKLSASIKESLAGHAEALRENTDKLEKLKTSKSQVSQLS